MASRNSFDPQVIAYWFTSAAIASIALRLMSSGAEKSGNPCDRFTAPCFNASRVISRITDSVNELAFCETCLFENEGLVIGEAQSTQKRLTRQKLCGQEVGNS